MGNVIKLILGFAFIIAVVALSYDIYLLANSEEGQELRNKVEKLHAENTKIERQNQKLSERIHALKYDSRAIERAVRDELGLVRPDEVIIYFKSPNSQP